MCMQTRILTASIMQMKCENSQEFYKLSLSPSVFIKWYSHTKRVKENVK